MSLDSDCKKILSEIDANATASGLFDASYGGAEDLTKASHPASDPCTSCLQYTSESIDKAERPKSIADGLAYSHTPEYKQKFDKAIGEAYSDLNKHLGEKKIAIVSDLDETLFDNRAVFEQQVAKSQGKPTKPIDRTNMPVLEPTAEFLKFAHDHGAAVFLVTGRMEKYRLGTVTNLERREVAYDGLFMRKDGLKERAEIFKSEAREQIEKMGFDVVVNIGDQESDLAKGYADNCVKLPNKIYFIP